MISKLLPCDVCECDIVSMIQDSINFGNESKKRITISCFHCGHFISSSEPFWHDFDWDEEQINCEKRLLVERWNVRLPSLEK